MHFDEADTGLLGGSVFKCEKYVGLRDFGTKTLLGPAKGTQIVHRINESYYNLIWYCSD